MIPYFLKFLVLYLILLITYNIIKYNNNIVIIIKHRLINKEQIKNKELRVLKNNLEGKQWANN